MMSSSPADPLRDFALRVLNSLRTDPISDLLRVVAMAFFPLMTLYGFVEWITHSSYSGLAEFLVGMLGIGLVDIARSLAAIKRKGDDAAK
jgi:membrane protein required for beta-lactamase induction